MPSSTTLPAGGSSGPEYGKDNLALRSGGIATATNRILFSLLFLRIAEDRGLVAEGTLKEIMDNQDRYGQLLEVTAPLARLFGDGPARPAMMRCRWECS